MKLFLNAKVDPTALVEARSSRNFRACRGNASPILLEDIPLIADNFAEIATKLAAPTNIHVQGIISVLN